MTRTKRLTLGGMFAALIAILTYFPHISVATGGYIHLGDSLIYTASIIYGGVFGAATAGIGSAITDLLLAPQYAVPTLIIKGLMGFAVGKISNNKEYVSVRNIIAMIIGGFIMMVGYGIYDAFTISTGQSWYANFLFSISLTSIQYVSGVAVGILILLALKKANFIKR